MGSPSLRGARCAGGRERARSLSGGRIALATCSDNARSNAPRASPPPPDDDAFPVCTFAFRCHRSHDRSRNAANRAYVASSAAQTSSAELPARTFRRANAAVADSRLRFFGSDGSSSSSSSARASSTAGFASRSAAWSVPSTASAAFAALAASSIAGATSSSSDRIAA